MSRFGPPPRPAADRVLEKCSEDANGCWLFNGARNHRGYGQVGVNGRTRSAHRVTYEALRAEIPDGLHLDHLCRVRHCVNPWHLEPVTNAVNKERSRGHVELLHPTCSEGHPWSPENTYRAPSGLRHCRECARRRGREYKARQKASGSGP